MRRETSACQLEPAIWSDPLIALGAVLAQTPPWVATHSTPKGLEAEGRPSVSHEARILLRALLYFAQDGQSS